MPLVVPRCGFEQFTQTFELDYLTSYSICGFKRVISSYPVTSPLVLLRRDSDNATQDFYPDGSGWVNSAAVQAWLIAGSASNAYLVKAYDQAGSSRWFQNLNNDNRQPLVDLSLSKPCALFQGGTAYLSGSSISAFAQNANSSTLLAVRQHITTNTNQTLTYFSVNGASGARIALTHTSSNKDRIAGQRLDAGSNSPETGINGNTNWGVFIGAADWANGLFYSRVDGTESSTDVSGTQGTGATSNTTSSTISFGRTASSSNYFNGRITLFACIQGMPDRDRLQSSLQTLKAGS